MSAERNEQMKIFPPLVTTVACYTLHAGVEFAGHRKYRRLEVLSRENEDGRVYVHIIITDHENQYIRFINDRDSVDRIKTTSPAKKVFYSEIQYGYLKEKGIRKLKLRFFTHKNEEITLLLTAHGKARENKYYMVRPSGYLQWRELPIALTPHSHRISLSASGLRINNREYTLLPNFTLFGRRFGSSAGKLSCEYIRLTLTVPNSRLKVIKDDPFQDGELVFGEGIRERKYTLLDDNSKHRFVLSRDHEKLYYTKVEGELCLSKIEVATEFDEHITINFLPPLTTELSLERHSGSIEVLLGESVVFQADMYITLTQDGAYKFYISGDGGGAHTDGSLSYTLKKEGDWVLTEILPL